MTAAAGIGWHTIAGVSVAVFEDHHHALVPWSRWRTGTGSRAPRLITIDHHCDTKEAFGFAAYTPPFGTNRVDQRGYLAAIDRGDETTIEIAIERLRHDEHIDAAIRSGILDAAFVVAESTYRGLKSLEHEAYDVEHRAIEDPTEAFLYRRWKPVPDPPMTYAMPDHRMVLIDPNYYRRGTTLFHPWPDEVLESEHLEDRLRIFEQMLRDGGEPLLEGTPYILDVDMDVFRTWASLSPRDPSTFHRLVRGAIGVTVALERSCCHSLWIDEAPVDTAATEKAFYDLLVSAFA